MFIDVHCHIDFYKDKEIKEIVERARKNRVGIIVNNGINPETNRRTLELAEEYNEIKAALGIYPIDALKMSDSEIDSEIDFIRENKNDVAAIGEVGIDLKESQDLEKQKENFQKFIDLSIELNKPIIVHSRKAELECIEMLEKAGAKKVIMHVFSGKFALLKRIEENGWYVTVPTNSKYSEQFQIIAEKIKIKNLLCETDSPFMHPEKERNNEPKNIIESYRKIAQLKDLDMKDVEKEIESNYKNLFGKGL